MRRRLLEGEEHASDGRAERRREPRRDPRGQEIPPVAVVEEGVEPRADSPRLGYLPRQPVLAGEQGRDARADVHQRSLGAHGEPRRDGAHGSDHLDDGGAEREELRDVDAVEGRHHERHARARRGRRDFHHEHRGDEGQCGGGGREDGPRREDGRGWRGYDRGVGPSQSQRGQDCDEVLNRERQRSDHEPDEGGDAPPAAPQRDGPSGGAEALVVDDFVVQRFELGDG